ncbi:hypothetical protein JWG44_10350 [Leptospira sp. 201903071]|uniref:hypothetical protein n=1 Tax=Leptospira ainazelensis TaxID=2810034 RepID=UPI00196271E1|nr:hypothetical protein [Leptospira ainazelensis]MBM9500646.1 hypothetical protein [Leptospira ainazelensis]
MRNLSYILGTILLELILVEALDVIAFVLFPDIRLPGLTSRSFPFGFRHTLGVYFKFPLPNILLTSGIWGISAFLTFFTTSWLGVSKWTIVFGIAFLSFYSWMMPIPFLFRILPLFVAIVSSVVGVASGRFVQKRLRSEKN